jgi:hypothetical protein
MMVQILRLARHSLTPLPLSLYLSISLQVETGLIIGLPEATQEDIEELMAILTVATRSLSRKVCPPSTTTTDAHMGLSPPIPLLRLTADQPYVCKEEHPGASLP